eukprot:UN05986
MQWKEQALSTENLDTVVNQGRQLGVMLNDNNQQRTLRSWGREIFDQLSEVAEHMDKAYGVTYYSETIAQMATWVDNPALTFSRALCARARKT